MDEPNNTHHKTTKPTTETIDLPFMKKTSSITTSRTNTNISPLQQRIFHNNISSPRISPVHSRSNSSTNSSNYCIDETVIKPVFNVKFEKTINVVIKNSEEQNTFEMEIQNYNITYTICTKKIIVDKTWVNVHEYIFDLEYEGLVQSILEKINIIKI